LRLFERTGVEMGPLALFEAPMVEELAQRLATARKAGAAAQPALRSRQRHAAAPNPSEGP
jgi:hypothetical protein